MDPISLGLALTILGMGGTLLTLYVVSLVADLLKRLFPLAREQSASAPQSAASPPVPSQERRSPRRSHSASRRRPPVSSPAAITGPRA